MFRNFAVVELDNHTAVQLLTTLFEMCSSSIFGLDVCLAMCGIVVNCNVHQNCHKKQIFLTCIML